MITRNQAIELIESHVGNKNIVKHMFALEALMGGIWEELKSSGKTEDELGGTKEEWMMAGLLHDGDYCEGVPMTKQGIQITDWARQVGYEIPDNVANAMAAHNWENTKVEPKTLMDWTIYCGDSLTGLIVACALILPDKKLSVVSVDFVLKKFKQPSFAAGTRREDITLCAEKIGVPLEEFIKISLSSMTDIATSLSL